jgi:SNF2 family DNA or RNA helicase
VYISTYVLSGIGLTLTAANKMFLLEPAWRESTEQQGLKRISQIGQTLPNVYIWKLHTPGMWIEEEIQKRHQTHEQFIDLDFSVPNTVEVETDNEVEKLQAQLQNEFSSEYDV